MPIRIVRLGSPRLPNEGLRLGTVRRPPRGVKKEDFARRDFFDVWIPELAPTPEVVTWALSKPWTAKRWQAFARKYRTQLKQPMERRLLALLAALSTRTDLSVGCYCEDESRCHRSLLREMLVEQGAVVHE